MKPGPTEADSRSPGAPVSILIPALNEAAGIVRTIRAAWQHCHGLGVVEVIVADHGSTDGTAILAKDEGATVISCSGGTVGRLRNFAAKHASGEVFVFLDADVVLTEEWGLAAPRVISAIQKNSMIMSGSRCVPPECSQGVFDRYWFAPMSRSARASHIGSGHLIIHRDLFCSVGGFSEQLQTGEDYDICARARQLGAVLRPDQSLRVVHYGYPSTVSGFVRRERWHGLADARSLQSALQSKVMLATISFVAAHLILLASVAFSWHLVAACALLWLLLLLGASTIQKLGWHGATIFFFGAAVMYLYYVGRAWALIGGAAGRSAERRFVGFSG